MKRARQACRRPKGSARTATRLLQDDMINNDKYLIRIFKHETVTQVQFIDVGTRQRTQRRRLCQSVRR